ncbi:MAG: F0F1 ATP synthase subunit epsilon [Candidatus Electryonea clarkiae]|nr:F0F1 ATP synthase subunit epsilon [Candidatus Electryonea clarkiae]MDP8286308.1 F0F1 ATP synthase subunit epsilon [Candidatus Electryonea clarkiae]
MAVFKLEIVTPDGLVFDGEVEHVGAPGVQGSFGVLSGHTPFLTPLSTGEISVRVDGKDRIYATSGGLADVNSGGMVILAETAENAENIDVERAKNSQERARRLIIEAGQEVDSTRAKASLHRAQNRLRIANIR